jgi:hypothetical protein
METKACKKCGVTKELIYFVYDKSCKNERANTCKVCHNAENKEYRKRMTPEQKKRDNLIKLKSAKKRYNKDKHRELTRKYRASVKGQAYLEKVKQRRRKKRITQGLVVRTFKDVKNKKKKCTFCHKTLSFDQFHANKKYLISQCKSCRTDPENNNYIKYVIIKKTKLKYKDVPQKFVELKRTEIKLKRLIKNYETQS